MVPFALVVFCIFLKDHAVLYVQLLMAGVCLFQLAVAALSIFLGIFVVANTDFCGSVFETQVGKLKSCDLKRPSFLFFSVCINRIFASCLF